jgi:hypothetical protein
MTSIDGQTDKLNEGQESGRAPGGDRPTEDDIAQARLGGPRGAPELKPAPMTPQRRKKTPTNFDPGHTA